MDMLILIILGVLIVGGFVATIVILLQKIQKVEDKDSIHMLKTDLVEMNRSIASMQQHMGEKLDNSSLRMQQSMQRQLGESARLVSDVSNRLTKLDETDRKSVV